jgi:hypothetical protein
MDARAVSEATGVGINTLNVWVARGFVPGMTIGARGRQRDFDLKTLINVALIMEVTRLGVGAGAASELARDRGSYKRLMLATPGVAPETRRVIMLIMELARLGFGVGATPATPGVAPAKKRVRVHDIDRWHGFLIVVKCDSDADLLLALQIFQDQGVAPAVYTIINVELIAAGMRRANQAWKRRNRGKGAT